MTDRCDISILLDPIPGLIHSICVHPVFRVAPTYRPLYYPTPCTCQVVSPQQSAVAPGLSCVLASHWCEDTGNFSGQWDERGAVEFLCSYAMGYTGTNQPEGHQGCISMHRRLEDSVLRIAYDLRCAGHLKSGDTVLVTVAYLYKGY